MIDKALLPKNIDSPMRDLPKGVYKDVLKDGSVSYRYKSWIKGGKMVAGKNGFSTPREAEYARHVAMYGHHWEDMPLELDDYFGFTYCMTEIATGRKYIGSKQLMFWDGPQGGYKCTEPRDEEFFDESLWRVSDWPLYTSSSRPVARLVGDEPWKFRYEVCLMAHNKLELHLDEIGIQVDLDVLHAVDEDGEYQYLNENILGVEYRPPVPREKLKAQAEASKLAMRDYYLKPSVCPDCNTVIPYGQTRCINEPMFGNGGCGG